MAHAIMITTEGTASLEQIHTLADFQRHVGGWVEALGTDDEAHILWLNEEGKLMGLPVNERADALTRELVTGLVPGDRIVGPVVITGPLAQDGETYETPSPEMLARFELALT